MERCVEEDEEGRMRERQRVVNRERDKDGERVRKKDRYI